VIGRRLRAYIFAGFLVSTAAVSALRIYGALACCEESMICDYLENEYLRWLAGCKPLDSGAR
jgi:hypothetical protein